MQTAMKICPIHQDGDIFFIEVFITTRFLKHKPQDAQKLSFRLLGKGLAGSLFSSRLNRTLSVLQLALQSNWNQPWCNDTALWPDYSLDYSDLLFKGLWESVQGRFCYWNKVISANEFLFINIGHNQQWIRPKRGGEIRKQEAAFTM